MEIDNVPAHAPRRASRRRLLSWLAVGCVLFAAACSSGSDDAAADAADGDLGADPTVEREAGSATGDGDGEANPVADGPVCDLIEPGVDDIAAAIALDVALHEESPRAIPPSGCSMNWVGSEISLGVTVGRFPAILSSVQEAVSSMVDAQPVRALPSLGDDAQLIQDGLVETTYYVLFSTGERVWQVTVSDGSVGAIGGPGPDTAEIAPAVAEVVKDRLEG